MPKRAIASPSGGASSSAMVTRSQKRICQSFTAPNQTTNLTPTEVSQELKLTSLPPEILTRVIHWYLEDSRRGCSHCEIYHASSEMPQGQRCLQQLLPVASTSPVILEAVSSCLTTDTLWRDFVPARDETEVYNVLHLAGINLAQVKLEFSWYLFAAHNLQEIDLSGMPGDDVTVLLGKLVNFQPRLRSLSLRKIRSKVVGVSSAAVLLKRFLRGSSGTLQNLTIPSRPVAVRDAILATKFSSLRTLSYVPMGKLKRDAEPLPLILSHLRDVNAPLEEISFPTESGPHWTMPDLSVLAPSVRVLRLRDDCPIMNNQCKGLRRYDEPSLKGLLKHIVTLTLEDRSAPATVSWCISKGLLPCLENTDLSLQLKIPDGSVSFLESCDLTFPVLGSSLKKLVMHQLFSYPFVTSHQITIIADSCPNLEILDLRVKVEGVQILADYIRTSKHLREISLASGYDDPISTSDPEDNMITSALLNTSSKLERVRQLLFFTKPADAISMLKQHGKWLKCLHLSCVVATPVSRVQFSLNASAETEIKVEDTVKIYEYAQQNCPNLENLAFDSFELNGIGLWCRRSRRRKPPEPVRAVIAQTKNLLPKFKDKSMEWKPTSLLDLYMLSNSDEEQAGQ